MKANELRIGNYIQGNYIEETENADITESCVCQVDILDNVGCTEYKIWASSIEDKGKLIEEWDSFTGLVLNDELLLRLGFIKKEGEFFKDEVRFTLFETKLYKGYLFCDGIKVLREVETAHILQNLWFSLIGEELLIAEE